MSSEMKTVSLEEADSWPNNGCDYNLWFTHFKEFAEILSSAQGETYWIVDHSLKYLNIRVDTRFSRFVLSVDGRGESREKTIISPLRVVRAINRYRENFTSNKELISEIPQARN